MSPTHTGITEATRPTVDNCRATREILDRIADKWSLFVIAMLRDGPRRFNELRRDVTGISQRMLTLTLRTLERDGLVTRTMYPTIPPRVDYELTELAKGLLGPVMGLVMWAETNKETIAAARKAFDDEAQAGAALSAQRAAQPWR
ncbi:helix-turn-helix transcriptional regulator [Dyella sp. LX-66]|uniref:winged helix-turn-helix transcriptional regulator n=1 Tax=unclassified Dyella TaxID=2634549 RepID=UPI001BE0317D|nr:MULTISPECIES: helix-turn-helix domain-containing protein [unclassified Dyella]MBT2117047.1 helix-turn-helix transcriptional regulator [Dyella sp. LX-1]MBT2139877.1 helix-turn-helix transcriptional regulator [Dyella sp. LX-66]